MKTAPRLFVAAIAIASPLIAFKPASALGIYGYSVSAVSDPYTYSPPSNFANQTPSLMVIPTTVSSAVSLPNGTNANGSVTGSAGTLKAYAFAELLGDGATNAQTHSSVRAEDQFTVSSSTLAPGTPVNLLFKLNLDGSLLPRSINGTYFGNNAVAVFFNAGDGQTNGLSLGYTSDSDPLLSSGSGPIQINRLLTGTITTAVGRQVNMDYSLDVFSYLIPGYPVTKSEVDFGHTSRFFVDSQTSDVVLTSFSGHNYASPTAVPTPALLPSLMALGASILRQRKKVCA